MGQLNVIGVSASWLQESRATTIVRQLDFVCGVLNE